MCTGLEIIALAGLAAGATGGLIQYNEAQNNANAQMKAANDELFKMMAKNKQLADEARLQFDQQLGNYGEEAIGQNLSDAQTERTENLQKNISTSAPGVTEIAALGNAPAIVQQAYANQADNAVNKSMANAAALGALGGYGDFMHGNQLDMTGAARNVGMLGGFAQSNAAMLPAMQQYASVAATKPPSIWGDLLTGGGKAAATYAGAKGAKLPFLSDAPLGGSGPMNIVPGGYNG